MRKLIGGALLMATILCVCVGVLFAQEGSTQKVIVEWDHSGLDINGAPERLASFDLAVSATNVDMNAGGTPLEIQNVAVVDAFTQGDQYESGINSLLENLNEGDYRIWVRAVDEAGNVSEWTQLQDDAGNVTTYNLDKTVPSAVGKVTVRVQVNVTVNTGQ